MSVQMLKRISRFLRTFVVRAVAVVLVVATFQYVFNADSRARHDSLREELDRMQRLNRTLADENERLRLQVDAIKTDDRYLEKMARQEFGMIREGETVYRFVPTAAN